MKLLNAKWLASFQVGEYRYLEVSDQDWQKQMSQLASMLSPNRRAKVLEGYSFSQKAFTAVGTTVGETLVLVKLVRTT